VRLPGQRSLVRACSECVNHARNVEVWKFRAHQLGLQLHGIALDSAELGGQNAQISDSLEDAVFYCEQAIEPLHEMYSRIAPLQARIDQVDSNITKLFAGGGSVSMAQDACPPSFSSGDDSMQTFEAMLEVSRRTFSRQVSIESKLDDQFACKTFGEEEFERLKGGGSDVQVRTGSTRSEVSSPSSIRTSVHSETPSKLDNDAGECFICSASLGSRLALKSRHMCCICGNCICSSCSSTSVKFGETKASQCVCTFCIGSAQESLKLRPRIVQLGNELSLCTHEVPVIELRPSEGIPAALSACENAVVPLQCIRMKLTGLEQLEQKIMIEIEKRREAEKG